MLFDCNINGDYSYCLSISNKKYEYMCRNFNAVGLRSPIHFAGPTDQKTPGAGCLRGHFLMVSQAKQKNLPYVFLYEEDTYPRPDIIQKFNYLKTTMPDNCGLFVMGYSGWKGTAIKINKDFYQFPVKPFGSHAYLIHRDCYDTYLNSLRIIKCPDKAFTSVNFAMYAKHPYWPTPTNILFIQKNIDCNCITSRLGGERYWYPNYETGLPVTASGAPLNFSEKLIDLESQFLEPIHKVSHPKWQYEKNLCKIENDTIQRFNEIGDLTTVEPNKVWTIKWRHSGKSETLILDRESNGCFYYHIVEMSK